MSNAAVLMGGLYGAPGNAAGDPTELVEQAASAHADLLLGAWAQADPAMARALAPLQAFIQGPAAAAEKRRLLCHPLFLEGLHGLAPFSPALGCWHDTVTASPGPAAQAAPAAKASLGNVCLVLLLRAEPNWQGEHDLCTDVLGRVGFPFCDWTLTLHNDRHDLLARQAIRLSLEHDWVRWRLGDSTERPFLIMSRADCLRMIVGNRDPPAPPQLEFPNPRLRPRLQRTSSMRHSKIRYDPIGFQDFQAHAGLTGGLVQRVLAATRHKSPAVYRELGTFMHTIRGFELPGCRYGVIQSFSDPTLPGVMGINICYSRQHEPCLDPFCFTWLGHELGHTKDYLCANILYGRGQTLVRNPAEYTQAIPRYGRPLAMRTLFQVPYVHLYEWALLTDFWEAGFRGLPWRVPKDVVAKGEDLAAEIEEAFTLIRQLAQLTPLGMAALHHFQKLFVLARARWRSVRSRECH